MHTCIFPAYCRNCRSIFLKLFSAPYRSNAFFFAFMKDSWIRRQNRNLKTEETPRKKAMRIRIALSLHVEKRYWDATVPSEQTAQGMDQSAWSLWSSSSASSDRGFSKNVS